MIGKHYIFSVHSILYIPESISPYWGVFKSGQSVTSTVTFAKFLTRVDCITVQTKRASIRASVEGVKLCQKLIKKSISQKNERNKPPQVIELKTDKKRIHTLKSV